MTLDPITEFLRIGLWYGSTTDPFATRSEAQRFRHRVNARRRRLRQAGGPDYTALVVSISPDHRVVAKARPREPAIRPMAEEIGAEPGDST